MTTTSQSTNCKDCDYQFPKINDKSTCPKCGSTKKHHKLVVNETVKVTERLTTVHEGKRTFQNYYAWFLALLITAVAIYVTSLDNSFLINVTIGIFLASLDGIAFYYAITRFRFKETTNH